MNPDQLGKELGVDSQLEKGMGVNWGSFAGGGPGCLLSLKVAGSLCVGGSRWPVLGVPKPSFFGSKFTQNRAAGGILGPPPQTGLGLKLCFWRS